MKIDHTIPSVLPRVIRVFVSSTFCDMQAERDELVKFIFPQLRKLCEKRGVIWGEVDLRWGITDEQKSEGQVLPICLEEIHRCRPYFIGILGERYGWIPDKISPKLIEREPWLKEQFDRSVTELEILHGVLNNPEMAEHAFFYFRDPDYIKTCPPEQRSTLQEDISPEDVEKYGHAEAQRRVQQRRTKLLELKERIRNSGFPVDENFQNPKEFGQHVLKDLTRIIEELYPEGSQLIPLDREENDHEIFALSRAKVYIGRQTYFDQLDAYARSDGMPVVIVGESGSGKSAMLANWALQYRMEHQDELVLMHFIGATPDSTDWAAMLHRILSEFKRKFDIREEIPDNPDALRNAFANWLNMASAQGRVVLVLDALDKLSDRDGAPDLVWLPDFIPANVHLYLSSLPGRSLEEIKKRGWQTLAVEPLQHDERRQLIKQYLALYTKELDYEHTERIASSEQCQSPLFLRILLDELRLFGNYEQLSDQIDQYLNAGTIPALYELILKRCEHDYENERPGLVRDAMSLIWAARRGLAEVELMELLGANETPLPRAYWSPLYLSLEQSFLSRGGLINFFHDYLRQAVQNRYFPDIGKQKNAHLCVADYFEGKPAGSPRRIDELPWQLAQAKEWQRIIALLVDGEFLKNIWAFNSFDVKMYWAQIEKESTYRLPDVYRRVVDHPGDYPNYIWLISELLGDTGYLAEALTLRTYLVEYYRKTNDMKNLQISLCSQANIYFFCGDLDKAFRLHKEQESLCRQMGDDNGLQLALGNQALILMTHGDMDGSMVLYKEQERICRSLGDKINLSVAFCGQATILHSRGKLNEAMALYKEQEHICRELGNMERLCSSYSGQALVHKDLGELDEALILHKEEEKICRQLGYKAGLVRSLCNQALILADRSDLDGAMALHKEEEMICRELGDKMGLGRTFGNQALILKERGDLNGSLVLQKEYERICREVGNKDGLHISLGNQANILYARGDLEGALALYKEKEQICRDLDKKTGISNALSNQALILSDRGNFVDALALHKESERICRELGYKVGLQDSLGFQGNILKTLGDLDGAMRLYKEKEHICRELGDKIGLSQSLSNQANILHDRGDLEGALDLHEQVEEIYREIRHTSGLSTTLNNKALVLADLGELDKAMLLLTELENICDEQKNPEGMAILLKNKAIVLSKMGKNEEATRLAKESLLLAQKYGLHALARQIRSNTKIS